MQQKNGKEKNRERGRGGNERNKKTLGYSNMYEEMECTRAHEKKKRTIAPAPRASSSILHRQTASGAKKKRPAPNDATTTDAEAPSREYIHASQSSGACSPSVSCL